MGNIVQHRTHRNNRYTTINLTAVEDKRLSGLAKAIHLYAMSRPPDWTLTMQDIYNRFKEGRDAIYVALQCLVDTGYLYRNQDRNDKSKFNAVVYHWFEEPRPDIPFTDIPDTGAPDTEIPVNGKPATTIYQDYVPQALENQGGSEPPTLTGRDWAERHIDCMDPWFGVGTEFRRAFRGQAGADKTWLARKLKETFGDVFTAEEVSAQIKKLAKSGVKDCKPWDLFKVGANDLQPGHPDYIPNAAETEAYFKERGL